MHTLNVSLSKLLAAFTIDSKVAILIVRKLRHTSSVAQLTALESPLHIQSPGACGRVSYLLIFNFGNDLGKHCSKNSSK